MTNHILAHEIRPLILKYVLLAINDCQRDVDRGVHSVRAKRKAVEAVARAIDENAGEEHVEVDWT